MSDIKVIRGQLRQIAKEILPEVLSAEMETKIMKHVDTRLDYMTNMIKSTLDQLDRRSKDMQSYVVRNVGVPTKPPEEKNE